MSLYNNDKKFRVAVCFSGQARHWQASAGNIKRFFNNDEYPHPELGIPVQTDYFIHTWDTNTWRYPKMGHEHNHNEKHNDGAAIKEAYNPLAMEVETWIPEKFKRSWDPMFYSLAKSLLMKRDHELKNQFQYDIVVKARLDTIYNPAHRFPLFRIWPGIAYTCTAISKFPTEFNYNNFDDVLFYAQSPVMDLLGDLYATYKHLHSADLVAANEAGIDLQPDMYYGPGCLIYEHLTNLGIHPDGNRHIEYAVVRSTAVEENLDGIYDYDKIRRKWFEWYI